MATFIVNLYDEATGNTMDIDVDYDCTPDEESAILSGRFGKEFTTAAFDRISVIPVSVHDDEDSEY